MTKNSFVLFYFTSANTKRSFVLTNSMKLNQETLITFIRIIENAFTNILCDHKRWAQRIDK